MHKVVTVQSGQPFCQPKSHLEACSQPAAVLVELLIYGVRERFPNCLGHQASDSPILLGHYHMLRQTESRMPVILEPLAQVLDYTYQVASGRALKRCTVELEHPRALVPTRLIDFVDFSL